MWHDGWNMLWMLFIATLITGVALVAFRYSLSGPKEPPEDPETILKRRLARGEITEDQYETLHALLRR